MPLLNIKPTHKPIKNYYAELQAYDSIGAEHEGAVRTAFQNLLQHYSRQADLILDGRLQLDVDITEPRNLVNVLQTPDVPLDWRVEKMKLSKDKTQIVYNNFLTLDGIPEKVFDYRLGTRSALEWIINQYCVKIDKRSGIVNDPNRHNDPQYIVKLIGKVISVSLETVKVVEGLTDLDLG